jgi:hypothetical protein
MTTRLNARLDGTLARKLEFLKRRTRKTVTEIVREAIERYYEQTRGEHGQARHVFDDTGFIGCGEGDADLSSAYKRELADLVEKKTAR